MLWIGANISIHSLWFWLWGIAFNFWTISLKILNSKHYFEIADEFGNKNWRKEESQGESQVVGSYGFLDANGIAREVEYIANEDGFKAQVPKFWNLNLSLNQICLFFQIKTNEPGTASNKNPADVSLDANPMPAPEQKNYAINQQISQLHDQRSESIHFPTYRQYLASVQ
jgi:hypothetical protein